MYMYMYVYRYVLYVVPITKNIRVFSVFQENGMTEMLWCAVFLGRHLQLQRRPDSFTVQNRHRAERQGTGELYLFKLWYD